MDVGKGRVGSGKILDFVHEALLILCPTFSFSVVGRTIFYVFLLPFLSTDIDR